jgi:hypothetical protein
LLEKEKDLLRIRHFKRLFVPAKYRCGAYVSNWCLLSTSAALITMLMIAQAIPDRLLRLHP